MPCTSVWRSTLVAYRIDVYLFGVSTASDCSCGLGEFELWTSYDGPSVRLLLCINCFIYIYMDEHTKLILVRCYLSENRPSHTKTGFLFLCSRTGKLYIHLFDLQRA
jgi:hypothetical protein